MNATGRIKLQKGISEGSRASFINIKEGKGEGDYISQCIKKLFIRIG